MPVARPADAAPLARVTELFFPRLAELGDFVPVDPGALPADYRTLLAHDNHMTVAVESFHGSPVDVVVLTPAQRGEDYARTSVLVTKADGRRVQFGVMHINTSGLPDAARAMIHSGATPLGRILIKHNVLRKVELCQLWQISPGPVLQKELELEPTQVVYGRTARILVGGRAAVSLLEIVKA